MTDIFDELDIPEKQFTPETKKISDNFKFFGYKTSPQAAENLQKQAMQKVFYPVTELTTSALGASGDILSFLNEIIARPLTKKITGSETSPYEQTLVGKILPSSEMLHGAIETLAGKKIRPETFGEELLGTGAGFLGSMFGLGAKGMTTPGKIPFTSKTMPASVKTLLNAFAPATAFVSTKKMDLPPWMQVGATIGTSLLMHRATGKSIKDINNELFKKRDELAKGIMIPGQSIVSGIDNLQSQMSKGFKTFSPKSKVYTLSDELKSKAQGGAVPLEDLIQMRTEALKESKLMTKQEKAFSDKYWNSLIGVIDDGIKLYESTNPEFGKIYREANSLYRGIEESKKMGNFLKKHWKGSTLGIAGEVLLKTLGIPLGGATIGGLAAGKTYNFTKALIKNPGFRKAYKDVLKSAANKNIRGTSRTLKNFNQIAEKEGVFENESKKDIFDELD